MYKKEITTIVFLIVFFVIIDFLVLPKKNETYNLISNSIMDMREQNLNKKEKELETAYELDDYLEYKLEYSKVLFKDIYRLKDKITIYKGKNNKIKKENLVVNNEGLVGIISKVNNNSSEVNLLYNENISLSVKINESYGILKSKDNNLIIEGIDNKANIEIGDLVTTSDISIYPEDIIVGKVSEITYDKYEIEQILTVLPVVDFNNINYVGVLTELRGEE